MTEKNYEPTDFTERAALDALAELAIGADDIEDLELVVAFDGEVWMAGQKYGLRAYGNDLQQALTSLAAAKRAARRERDRERARSERLKSSTKLAAVSS